MAMRPAQTGSGIPLEKLRQPAPLHPSPPPRAQPGRMPGAAQHQPQREVGPCWRPGRERGAGPGVSRRDRGGTGSLEQEKTTNSPLGSWERWGAQAERGSAGGGGHVGRGMGCATVKGTHAHVNLYVLLACPHVSHDVCVCEVSVGCMCDGCAERVASSALPGRAVHRVHWSQGGRGYCHELVRRILFSNRCHSNGEVGSSLPPDPSASSTARPADSKTICRCMPWAGVHPSADAHHLGFACSAGEGEPASRAGRKHGRAITSSTQRREGEDEGRRLQQGNYREV